MNTGIVMLVTDITSGRMGLLKLKNHRLWLQRLQIQHHRTIRGKADVTPPADTTSPADITPATDTDKEAKAEAVKEQTPGTGDDKRTLAWLLMFVIGGAGVIVFGKKNKFTDKI